MVKGIYNGQDYVPGRHKKVDAWVGEWHSHVYPSGLKKILSKYDSQLGDVVLDLGSGPNPLSFSLESPSKLILLDIVPQVCSLKKEGKEVKSVWGDLEVMIEEGTYSSLGNVDTVIASSIFNYVNWKKLIDLQSQSHNSNGYFFVANRNEGSGRGIKRLFSDKCPVSDGEVIDYFESSGYKIVEQKQDSNLNILVAKKL
jgi:hypothetical protein|tara:strand:+ start:58 stop:654 length:597 start_codon:yes stop_codon:yes gene_type:complete